MCCQWRLTLPIWFIYLFKHLALLVLFNLVLFLCCFSSYWVCELPELHQETSVGGILCLYRWMRFSLGKSNAFKKCKSKPDEESEEGFRRAGSSAEMKVFAGTSARIPTGTCTDLKSVITLHTKLLHSMHMPATKKARAELIFNLTMCFQTIFICKPVPP